MCIPASSDSLALAPLRSLVGFGFLEGPNVGDGSSRIGIYRKGDMASVRCRVGSVRGGSMSQLVVSAALLGIFLGGVPLSLRGRDLFRGIDRCSRGARCGCREVCVTRAVCHVWHMDR